MTKEKGRMVSPGPAGIGPWVGLMEAVAESAAMEGDARFLNSEWCKTMLAICGDWHREMDGRAAMELS